MPEQKATLGMLIWGFITILIGINLLVPIANLIEGNDAISTNNNRTLTFANNSARDLVDDNLISGSETVWGSLGGVSLLALNKGAGVNPNYTIDYTGGSITFINATPTNWYNNTPSVNVSYQFQGDNFVDNATARNIENLIIIFAAIAVFVVGVYLVMKGFEAFM